MAKLSDGRALPGKLLIVEGIDGSGKSTQLDMPPGGARRNNF
jgi:hypothetical protein